MGGSQNEVYSIVLLGKKGNGKSSTGNSLLGKRLFKSNANFGSGTAACEIQTIKLKNGPILNIIDTPGLCGMGGDEKIEKEFAKCIDMAKEGINAIVLVLSARFRFSQEEKYAIESLFELFGGKITDYMILLFTGGDNLAKNEETLDEYLGRDCPEPLKEILEKCGNRCVLFDNRTKDSRKKRKQLAELLVLVDEVREKNGGKTYTKEMFVELQLSEKMGGSENSVYTIVLLGKTGNGKSSTGNSLLGKRAFKSNANFGGGTTACELQTAELENGLILNIIDTPGLCDILGGDEKSVKEVVKCIDMAKNGINAAVLVLSARFRFSQEEKYAIWSLFEIFGGKITDYMILLFTGGDDLAENEETLDDYLGRDCPEPLKELLEKCGNRCVLFDNRTKDSCKKRKQLEELLVRVDEVMQKNDGKLYTKEMFVELKEEMKLRTFHVPADANSSKHEEQSAIMMYQEQLMRMTNNMIESTNMSEVTRKLEQQVAEEREARLRAEVAAKDAYKRSTEEFREMSYALEMANKRLEKLRTETRKINTCPIL